jgi:hypothetical protein
MAIRVVCNGAIAIIILALGSIVKTSIAFSIAKEVFWILDITIRKS